MTEEDCGYSLVLGHLPCLVCGALGLDPLCHRKHQSNNNSNQKYPRAANVGLLTERLHKKHRAMGSILSTECGSPCLQGQH